jgi:hypothetical protein
MKRTILLKPSCLLFCTENGSSKSFAILEFISFHGKSSFTGILELKLAVFGNVGFGGKVQSERILSSSDH